MGWITMTTLSRRDSKPSKINVINYSDVYKPNTKTIPSNYGQESYPKDAHEEKGSGIVTDARDDVTMHINQSCSWDSISPPLDEMTRKKYEIHDLLRVKKPAFLSNYKNPCWFEDTTRALRCIPYFHLVGFHKCGTTLTFSTIVSHPETVAPKGKETHWIAAKRFKESSNIRRFADRFSTAAKEIESRVLTDSPSGQTFHHVITGDGSPTTINGNEKWRYMPGNYNCTEPRVLNPHYLYHLYPSTKIIIMIRNPTDRMISAYNYMTLEYPHVTAESFHKEVVNEIRAFEECLSISSVRTCLYEKRIQVWTGLYHVVISDWMKVFPQEQILIARLEDIRDDPYISFSKIFEFLDLSLVSRSEFQQMQKRGKDNKGETRFQARNETRQLLDDFYRPYNIQLAKLLNHRYPTYT
ncbi:carbohydrate sulfotransferase 15-like [Haliotis rufescens]|uniref:carbohydrate sulfotransferase 15-like n=1 Tax=Haliotis rufescens TaxID=6454 RepID=UPI00201FB135|nr:carbohydrate sulfotransferase 15-like [Haliotis rufescens]